jgi:protein-S-isoprenylcysteine O-methyltransferase Ste14
MAPDRCSSRNADLAQIRTSTRLNPIYEPDRLGTPAPVAPTAHLVVGGPYRYVRNPIYLALVAAILGQAMLLWHSNLLWYAGFLALFLVAFVYGYEQPTLRWQFGAQYEQYRRAVPGWWPRLRPWRS